MAVMVSVGTAYGAFGSDMSVLTPLAKDDHQAVVRLLLGENELSANVEVRGTEPVRRTVRTAIVKSANARERQRYVSRSACGGVSELGLKHCQSKGQHTSGLSGFGGEHCNDELWGEEERKGLEAEPGCCAIGVGIEDVHG